MHGACFSGYPRRMNIHKRNVLTATANLFCIQIPKKMLKYYQQIEDIYVWIAILFGKKNDLAPENSPKAIYYLSSFLFSENPNSEE